MVGATRWKNQNLCLTFKIRAIYIFDKEPEFIPLDGSSIISLIADADLIIDGDDGDNAIAGTEATDTILGRSRNDFISGKGSADALFGEAGDDLIASEAAKDFLILFRQCRLFLHYRPQS